MSEKKTMTSVSTSVPVKPVKLNYFQRKKKERDEKKLAKKLLHEQNLIDKKNPKVCPPDVYVSMQNINKIYDNGFHAVHDFSIDIKQHEFIVFVGPSGCGKSTTLRMIAGLEDISGGNLFIDGEYMNDVAPKDRDIAMVFQSYALYPHMTVYENMAFPLKIMHLPKEEINRRVMHAAEILQITEWLDRKPKALSGGQRQRVALGRAIVHHAKVILMDEPLSNLDAKLRVQMRSEIVKLHNQLNATTIYVTHDQTEAMTMASRIVIMKDGYIQQIGTPIDIFNHPVNKFVAGFIGSPAMNIMNVYYDNGTITFKNGLVTTLSDADIRKHDAFYLEGVRKTAVRIGEIEKELSALDILPAIREAAEKELEVMKNRSKAFNDILISKRHALDFGIRPEDIHQFNPNDPLQTKDTAFTLQISLAELLGSEYYIHANFGSMDMIARFPAEGKIGIGDNVKVCFSLEKIHLFDLETQSSIL